MKKLLLFSLSICITFVNSLFAQSDQEKINSFVASFEYSAFSSANAQITSLIDLHQAHVQIVNDQIIDEDTELIVLPVVDRGLIVGLVIGRKLSNEGYLIFYQDNSKLIQNNNGDYYGKITIDLFNSNSSYSSEVNEVGELVSEIINPSPVNINNGNCPECRFVTPTFECIDNVYDTFHDRCKRVCRIACLLSDLVLASCHLGTYGGAAAWCANHNNNWQAYQFSNKFKRLRIFEIWSL